MRLSAIKLAGFKSFVDPAVLRLNSNLSGVVGPNGCGKSNVIDAVRWVLGESSARQLRGAALEDVIFNGSKARKPVGRAAIELVFDNSDGSLGGRYADFGEISVKREIVRDSGSQYFLNGARCRRRDITDLFLGTGLGSRSSYAIIEQGTVSRIIEARPEDMRLLLEEVAGISKYKEKRRETENRLQHTRQNLERLNDLRSELDAQLERLKRQSENAAKYKEYKKQERALKAECLALRYRSIDNEASTHRAGLGAAQERQAQAEKDARLREQAVDEARVRQQRAGEELQARQAEFYGAEAEVARIEQMLSHAREMAEVHTREIETLQTRRKSVMERLAAERARHATLAEQLAEMDAALEKAEIIVRDGREQLESAESESARQEAAWERFNRDAQAPLRRAEVERTRVTELERRQQGTLEREQRLEKELAGIDTEAVEKQLQQMDAQAQALEQARIDAESATADLEARIGSARERCDELAAELHSVREALQNSRGQASSLEALQAAALRRDDESLNVWLRQHDCADSKQLAETLVVEPGWELAVEAALSHFLRGVCVGHPHAEAYADSQWPPGSMTLIGVTDATPARAPRQGLVALAGKVRGPAPWTAGPVFYAVDDDADALALAGRLEEGEAAVARSGLCAGPGWLHWPGRAEGDTGVIVRERALARCREEIAGLTARHDERVRELEAARQTLADDETVLAERRAELTQIVRDASAVGGRHQAQSARLEQLRGRVERLRGDLSDLHEARDAEQGELAQARTRLKESEDEAGRLQHERQTLQATLQAARTRVKAARADHDENRDRLQALRVRQASLQSALQSAAEGERDQAERDAELERQLSVAHTALDQASAPVAEAGQALEQARGTRDRARAALDSARELQTETDRDVAASTQGLREAESVRDEARETVHSMRLSGEALQVRLQSVADQVKETGFDIETMLADLPEAATPTQWEEKLAAMDRRIQRLGAINLAAIDEYREHSERADYLAAQDEDLRAALATLENAIRKIDRETRSRFRESFDAVDTVFRRLFPKLFGGGEAYLEMAGDDLLDTGVRVMARPPGKRNSSIQLLSGGEKALTAVALVFSLFELNPAPFCLLDEVDAPLDDVNVGRFCGLVREMSERVQFVVITHNKVTMELAHQLHGVTMQEPGVSRLVSVDVERALEMAEERINESVGDYE